MANKRGIYLTTLIIVLLSSLNVLFFINYSGTSISGLSGRFIEDIPKLPFKSNISTIAFIINWIVILIIIFIAIARHIKNSKEDKLQISYDRIQHKKSRSETDLDILYNILLEKKKLRIGTISKTFKIDKDKALDWGKILENYNLARIEYPTFSEPEIRLYNPEKEKPKTEEKKLQPQQKNQDQEIKNQNEKENKAIKKNKKTFWKANKQKRKK